MDPNKILSVAEILLKPANPEKGPPLPDSFDLSWPGFFHRAIDRIAEEGPDAPWKTIKEKGLMAEARREFELITGRKLE